GSGLAGGVSFSVMVSALLQSQLTRFRYGGVNIVFHRPVPDCSNKFHPGWDQPVRTARPGFGTLRSSGKSTPVSSWCYPSNPPGFECALHWPHLCNMEAAITAGDRM